MIVVFATLKSVIPTDSTIDKEEKKETKVTTLRSAIQYINYLKQLIEDCDAGLVDKHEFDADEVTFSEANIGAQNKFANQNRKKSQKSVKKSTKSLVKRHNQIMMDTKWINYSQQFLENKFSRNDQK